MKKNQDVLFVQTIVKNTFKLEEHQVAIFELLDDYKSFKYDLLHSYDNRLDVDDLLTEWKTFIQTEIDELENYVHMIDEIREDGAFNRKFTYLSNEGEQTNE